MLLTFSQMMIQLKICATHLFSKSNHLMNADFYFPQKQFIKSNIGIHLSLNLFYEFISILFIFHEFLIQRRNCDHNKD
jgi:hypothetical protein